YLSFSLSIPLTLSLALSHSFSHTHTPTLRLTHPHSHTHTHALSLSLCAPHFWQHKELVKSRSKSGTQLCDAKDDLTIETKNKYNNIFPVSYCICCLCFSL